MARFRADEILRWVKGPNVLDVGCTSHTVELDYPYWLHGRLRKAFPGVVGIDISRENIELLRKAGLDNLHVQSAESFELPDRFDTIVAGEVIEHLSNPGLFLRRARQHLKDGGIVILTTPNPFSVAYFLYAFLKFPKTCGNPEHTCWFCLRTMTELAQRSGLEISRVEFIEDYDCDGTSFIYRKFGRFMKLFEPVIPKRLKKTILFVLAADGNPAHS